MQDIIIGALIVFTAIFAASAFFEKPQGQGRPEVTDVD